MNCKLHFTRTYKHLTFPKRYKESALHAVVHRMEFKQFTLHVFIDVEGAFANTTFDSIETALQEHGVSAILWLVTQLLELRAVRLGEEPDCGQPAS